MVELTWEQVCAKRHLVYDLLASMADWVRYDERAGTGLKPIGEPWPSRSLGSANAVLVARSIGTPVPAIA